MPSQDPASNRHASARDGIAIAGDLSCAADFIGRDQNITYGYSVDDVERLIDKVLAFLQAGASFVPDGNTIRAEVKGETLVFRPGAAQQLARRRDQRSYLLSLTVQREYQVWATKFIPLAARMDVQCAVEGLDMPVAFSEFRVPPPGSGAEARVTTVPLEDITEALANHPAFVILGEPGAGKTTTLQKIAFEAARHILSGGPDRVPLFVRLSQQGERTPAGFLRAEWEQRASTSFDDALVAGRILILADGINELPRDVRDQRLKAWRLFSTDYCQANQIVFSGRERDYDRQLDLPRVRVEPLDDARITEYLRCNDAEGLQELLNDPSTHLREMARNPFNLSLLVFAYRSNHQAMANRGRLLEWFADELFRREERLAHPRWLHRDVQSRALEQLAYTMQEQGESLTVPLQTARDALPQTVEFEGETVDVNPADLFRFARAGTILDPGIKPDVRFYHHLLQEYFAARELLRRFDHDDDLCELWRCVRLERDMPPATVGEWDPLPEPSPTGWEVTTILACGLSTDPARLIEAVRPHNPVLAGRCLVEAGIPQPEPVLRAVQADLLADLYDPAVHLRARLQAGFTLGRVGDPRFRPQEIDGVKVIIPKMVEVPGGTYPIGSADNDPDAYDREKPAHTVELPPFRIGKWPVTNAEYACFITAGGYQDERWWGTDLAHRWLQGEDVMGGPLTAWMNAWRFTQSTPNWREQLERQGNFSPDQLKSLDYIAGLSEDDLKSELASQLGDKSREQPHYWDDADYNNPSQPVVGITWFEARAYCAWLSAVGGQTYRLPTEVEWEAAARGPAGWCYSWGDEWDGTRANTIEGRVLKPSPAGAYAAAGGVRPFGAEDQTGNVWNWTASLFRPYPYQPDECEDVDAEGERAVRGGSFNNDRRFARCAYRDRDVPDYCHNALGFRVVSPGSISEC
ncbi:MAG: SUMF1/EgtB/PvdO family nonheme iron enzyme [Chloroflexi bacterium]|nr:SUMF1/EgtB/PvdO family nonheme iron enzyme [Chloroflexota bacterium]